MNKAGFTTHTLVPGIFLADKSRFFYINISSVRRYMKWHKFVTLMAKMVIFSLKRVAALHESTILCSAAIFAGHA